MKIIRHTTNVESANVPTCLFIKLEVLILSGNIGLIRRKIKTNRSETRNIYDIDFYFYHLGKWQKSKNSLSPMPLIDFKKKMLKTNSKTSHVT